MLRELAASFRHAKQSALRRHIIYLYLFLVGLNLAAWALALAVFHAYPATLSLCFLAYGLGLRHAVDADHIAAIDNVTRKLMQEGKRPIAVGFFFSLGHSSIVILMSLAVVYGTGYVKDHFPDFQRYGGIIGTSVSAFFLLLIAAINFIIFLEVFKRFQAARRGRKGDWGRKGDCPRPTFGRCPPERPDQPLVGARCCEQMGTVPFSPRQDDDALLDILSGPGMIARVLRALFRLVGESWHMYFVGFLFGLGFDTATEIALLGIAATQAAQQVPIWSIMVFPLLFTAGMCLLDTTDGIVMLGAYGWAFVKPVRKLFYNMTITLVSFVIALLIGSLEAISVLASKLQLDTGVWPYLNAVSENSTLIGYGIIGLMIASWLASILVYRYSGLDELDE